MTIDTSRKLVESGNYSIWSDFEYIEIRDANGRRWEVGYMYGNPEAALITWDERYAVVVGCGIMVCDLQRFDETVSVGQTWEDSPVVHLLAEPSDFWGFVLAKQVYQDNAHSEIRLATDLMDKHIGIYTLNTETLVFQAVPHGQPYFPDL
ncbi:hypothetical protein [Deinococcus sp. AJ005]|uniref:hypothetical protein n=1 Tax=Deinococcus sp. AJ005 TaxID=2652443 RepID=UPI00125CADD4|nr:hypothetical protein [Deinococcus sp. AJ005]QFP75876.1 hypothetical protein DAAJ005_04955 [Deinococcus sp. AJ005]